MQRENGNAGLRVGQATRGPKVQTTSSLPTNCVREPILFCEAHYSGGPLEVSLDQLAYQEKMGGNLLALLIPTKADFSLDLPAWPRQVCRLIKARYCSGNGFLLVGDTTGGFHTLRTSERRRATVTPHTETPLPIFRFSNTR